MSLTASRFGKVPDVQVNYVAHSGQEEISSALELNFKSEFPASIVEVICGRGWGKTLYFMCEILIPYMDTHANSQIMWVSPTYQIAQSPIEDILKGVNEETGERYVPEFDANGNRVWEFVTSRSGPVLRFWNNSTVYFRSADAPESIVSKGFNLIVIDEAALIQELVFTQQIMGTARKKGIKIFLITSPRGKKHWTYKYFLLGQDPANTDVISFQQPTWKNPFASATQKRLMQGLPEWVRLQEYEAQFIDEGDSVFKKLDDVFYGKEIAYESPQQSWEKPIEDIVIKQDDGKDITRHANERIFICSADLAKSVDYTVISVLDMESGDLVFYKRVNKEDYRNVLKMIEQVCHKYNHCNLIFDATGVGQGLGDMLHNYDVIAHPFVFTNDSKTEIVNKLALAIEYQQIQLPNIKTIRDELSVFTYTITRTGKISYNAPPGFHDDCVMSLAMANWYRMENKPIDTVASFDSIIKFNNGSNGRKRSFWDEMQDDDD